MTAAPERQHASARLPSRRISIGVVILVGLGALAACSSDGSPTGAIPPSGVTGVGGGTQGGGGGSGSGSSGMYTLVSVNDSSPPVQLFYDSASGNGTNGDTTTVFAGTLDSSFISLNTNGTAKEFDYLQVYEVRESSIPGDSNFSRTISIADSTSGTYTLTGKTVTVTRGDSTGTFVTTFALSGTTLTGQVPYSVDSPYGFPVEGTVTLVYDRTGSSLSSIVKKPPAAAAGILRSARRIHAQFGRRVSGTSAPSTRSP